MVDVEIDNRAGHIIIRAILLVALIVGTFLARFALLPEGLPENDTYYAISNLIWISMAGYVVLFVLDLILVAFSEDGGTGAGILAAVCNLGSIAIAIASVAMIFIGFKYEEFVQYLTATSESPNSFLFAFLLMGAYAPVMGGFLMLYGHSSYKDGLVRNSVFVSVFSSYAFSLIISSIAMSEAIWIMYLGVAASIVLCLFNFFQMASGDYA